MNRGIRKSATTGDLLRLYFPPSQRTASRERGRSIVPAFSAVRANPLYGSISRDITPIAAHFIAIW
jgi:hypothetical protein